MKVSNFRPVGTNASRRNTLKISTFLGVDFSSQKLEVQNGRAIDLSNYIFKDGVIQKRNGVEEINEVEPLKYVKQNFDGTIDTNFSVNDVNFNAIWGFIAEDGQTHIIAHIGKLLYEIKDGMQFIPLSNGKKMINGRTYDLVYEYENFKSNAFVAKNKLWFLGGNKFMCIRFLLDGNNVITPVEDIAYIPTTTINITKTGSQVGSRGNLDRVNLLSTMRTNKLLSGTPLIEDLDTKTEFNEYVLDSPLITKNQDIDMANFHMTIEERG